MYFTKPTSVHPSQWVPPATTAQHSTLFKRFLDLMSKQWRLTCKSSLRRAKQGFFPSVRAELQAGWSSLQPWPSAPLCVLCDPHSMWWLLHPILSLFTVMCAAGLYSTVLKEKVAHCPRRYFTCVVAGTYSLFWVKPKLTVQCQILMSTVSM